MIWGTVGPLAEPSNRSGVHAGPHRRCMCDPVSGASCSRCDGTGNDEWAIARFLSSATPEERRAFAVDMAAWNRRRAEWAAADAVALTTDPSGDAA